MNVDEESRAAISRLMLSTTMSLSLAVSLAAPQAWAQGVDLSKWSPEYVKSIAGTKEFDTAADCSKVTPLDYKGKLTSGTRADFEGDPDILRQN